MFSKNMLSKTSPGDPVPLIWQMIPKKLKIEYYIQRVKNEDL